MTDDQTILKMIETVDPNDTAKLDEIDQRVEIYLQHRVFSHIQNKVAYFHHPSAGQIKLYKAECGNYTRSRDALKAIRPNKYEVTIYARPDGIHNECQVGCFISKFKPTEELAELHAIIQAIAYERGQK